MKNKISLICLFLLLACLIFSQYSFAKYVINETSNLEVYIDKTPPIINIKTENSEENYTKTDLDTIIQKNSEITVSSSDNVKVDYNEYQYNSTTKDFSTSEPTKFDNGTTFTEDGYYKITSVDTSGNKTEIVILIDKTPPDVEVNYFKKGEETAKTEIVVIAAERKYLASENIVNLINEDEIIEETENVVENIVKETNTLEENTTVSENIIEENIVLEEKNTITEEVVKQIEIKEEIIEEKEILETKAVKNTGVSLMSARATANVYNESDLINAINNRISDIRIWTSINIGSTLNINYNVTISPATNENAIRFNGYGNFLNIQSGGTLNLKSIVVDTNSLSKNRGTTAINVQSGGKVVFYENSIVDGGANNKGIVVNNGGTALIYSCHIANCNKGIIVKNNGTLSFGNLGDGRNSEFWSNVTAISFESFSGTCNFNQSNIKIRNNTNGIIVESNTGKINLSAGQIYSNSSNGIVSKAGTFNISGGSIYSNGNGVNFGAGTLNFSGGNIYSNTTGVLLNSSYTGKFNMTGGKIYSNSSYAINHGQNADGCCTITGGTVTGAIYLAQNDNYVNTNDKYPTLTITPSTYFFKRKLVKTNSNEIANTEISKITMTAKSPWYKYVNDEYIVVWKGCNVKINRVDYFGNIISSEIITGNLGEKYETEQKEIEGYDLIEIPSNASGVYTEQDITVQYKYDLKNIAKVTFEDLLSGVSTAKYWYNSTEENFTGDGTDFENNTIFEDYGFYKIEVINNVGLKRELIFSLNKDSLKR